MSNKLINQGMTLIEMAIAMALAAVFSTVLIGITLQAQGAASSARLKNQSTKLAEQLVEKVVGFKKKNSVPCTFDTLNTYAGAYYKDLDISTCAITLPAIGSCNYASGQTVILGNNTFSYCFQLTAITPQLLRLDVNVFYLDHGKNMTTSVSTYLSNI